MTSHRFTSTIRAIAVTVVLALGFAGLTGSANAAPATKSRVATIHFASDSSSLSKTAQSKIRKAVKSTDQVDHYVVTGYVQNSGSDLNNKWLSLRRAKMVRGFMHKVGVKVPITVRSGGVPKHHGKSAGARKVTIVAVLKSKVPATPTTSPTPSPSVSPSPLYPSDRVTVISDQASVDSNIAGNSGPTTSGMILSAIWYPHGANDCGFGGCPNQIFLNATNLTFVPTAVDNDVIIQNDTFYTSIVKLNGVTDCPMDQNSGNLYVCQHVKKGDFITVVQSELRPG